MGVGTHRLREILRLRSSQQSERFVDAVVHLRKSLLVVFTSLVLSAREPFEGVHGHGATDMDLEWEGLKDVSKQKSEVVGFSVCLERSQSRGINNHRIFLLCEADGSHKMGTSSHLHIVRQFPFEQRRVRLVVIIAPFFTGLQELLERHQGADEDWNTEIVDGRHCDLVSLLIGGLEENFLLLLLLFNVIADFV